MGLLLSLPLLTAIPAFADLPSPKLDLLHPAGLTAGASVDVIIQGQDLEGCETLRLGHPGLTAQFLKAESPNRLHFKLTAADAVPVGTYDVFAVGRFGVTNPRVVLINRGLTDVAEVEPNNTPAQAQSVMINAAINGQGDGNNQDVFRLPLTRGQSITLDCWSARLETEMDPTLTVTSASGQLLASNADYIGRDPLIEFIAPEDGTYFVEVRDLIYRGGHPYRLLIHDRPRVENAFPRAITIGQPAALMLLGHRLGPEAQATPFQWGTVPLQQKPWSADMSADALDTGRFSFRVHPLQHSVTPTAATCTLLGEQVLPLDTDPVVLVMTDFPTGIEHEPNDKKEEPQALTPPVLISGRFDQPRDVDWYTFETDEQGGNYGFDVYAERIAGRCDPYLAIYDESGNRVTELDDFGHRMYAFDGHLRDPSGMVSLTAKKRYRLMVQDRYQRGGPRYQYVLSVRKARPDFFAASIHSQGNPSGTNVWQGSAASIDIILHHVDGGTKAPTTIIAEGLPPGLHMTPTVITNDMRGSAVLWSDDSAPAWTGPIRLTAISKDGERELRREVRPHTRSYQQTGSRPMREQIVTLRERGPYSLRIEPERITVEAGQKADVKLLLTRHWPDMTDAVNVQGLNWPGTLQMGNATIAAGQTELTVPVTVPGNATPGDYTVSILGQAQVPFHKNADEKNRPKTLVPIPSRPVTVTVTKPAGK